MQVIIDRIVDQIRFHVVRDVPYYTGTAEVRALLRTQVKGIEGLRTDRLPCLSLPFPCTIILSKVSLLHEQS